MGQDLGLELQKRNITQQREATTKEIDDGLESLPGVSSATTFVPSSDLTPRDVSRRFCGCYGIEGGNLHSPDNVDSKVATEENRVAWSIGLLQLMYRFDSGVKGRASP